MRDRTRTSEPACGWSWSVTLTVPSTYNGIHTRDGTRFPRDPRFNADINLCICARVNYRIMWSRKDVGIYVDICSHTRQQRNEGRERTTSTRAWMNLDIPWLSNAQSQANKHQKHAKTGTSSTHFPPVPINHFFSPILATSAILLNSVTKVLPAIINILNRQKGDFGGDTPILTCISGDIFV